MWSTTTGVPNTSDKLELPSLAVAPTAFWPLTFNPRRVVVMSDTHAKCQGQRSLLFQKSVETNRWMDCITRIANAVGIKQLLANILLCLGNNTTHRKRRVRYYLMLTGNHVLLCSTEWWHWKWPWVTFEGHLSYWKPPERVTWKYTAYVTATTH